MDERDGGLSTGSEDGVRAALEFADAGGEFERGGSAVEAVGVADAMLIPSVGDHGGGRKKGGRAAEGGGGQRAIARGDFRVGVDEFGLPGFGHKGWLIKPLRARL